MSELLSVMMWRSPTDFVEAVSLDVERGRITLEDLTGRVIRVSIIQEGNRLRAWCEECQRDDCIHAYMGIDLGIREIVKRVLEVHIGNYHEAITRVKRIRKRDIRGILRSLGIDLNDLDRYINRIGRKNAYEIGAWEEVIGRPKRFYL